MERFRTETAALRAFFEAFSTVVSSTSILAKTRRRQTRREAGQQQPMPHAVEIHQREGRVHAHEIPGQRRFTQSDPIGLMGGVTLYGYAAGDPIGLRDPFGLWPGWLPSGEQEVRCSIAILKLTGTVVIDGATLGEFAEIYAIVKDAVLAADEASRIAAKNATAILGKNARKKRATNAFAARAAGALGAGMAISKASGDASTPGISRVGLDPRTSF